MSRRRHRREALRHSVPRRPGLDPRSPGPGPWPERSGLRLRVLRCKGGLCHSQAPRQCSPEHPPPRAGWPQSQLQATPCTRTDLVRPRPCRCASPRRCRQPPATAAACPCRPGGRSARARRRATGPALTAVATRLQSQAPHRPRRHPNRALVARRTTEEVEPPERQWQYPSRAPPPRGGHPTRQRHPAESRGPSGGPPSPSPRPRHHPRRRPRLRPHCRCRA
mmetsp:Transcript_29895/g.99075  ORF Transcript_29895/g.99075 Transcript_29895/m.99075 type:complete len:222 (+) Transcript_29895:486-1151(+)